MPLRAFVVVLVMGVLLFGTPTFGQDQSSSPSEEQRAALMREQLRDLGPIKIDVSVTGADAERYGLTQQMLKTAVELRLRRNGIPIRDEPGPTLGIHVQALKIGFGNNVSYAFCFGADLHRLVRLPSSELSVIIWNVSNMAVRPQERVRSIRDLVLDHVDSFSNDYLAVNSQ